MRKSRIETAGTRERIVAAAAQLFLDKGLETVGTRDVMKAADLTGGGFYRHFTSKDQLITEAICAAFDRLFGMFEKEVAGKTGLEALERIATLYLEQSKTRRDLLEPYLCPLAQLGSELRHSTPAVQIAAFDGHERLASLIARYLADLPPGKAAAKANAIVSILVGAVTSAGLAPDRKVASRILRQAKVSVLESSAAGK